MEALPKLKEVYSHSFVTKVNAHVARPESVEQLQDYLTIAESMNYPICLIGGRNSFGSPFLLENSLSLDLTRLSGILEFNIEKKEIEVWGGTKITDILKKTLPQGLSLSSLSGSLNNTVGGNIGSNIHGKDSWKRGNFYFNILSIDLMTVNGTIRKIDPTRNKDLFNSLLGGMGLLGIVVKAKLKLISVPSTNLLIRQHVAKNIDDVITFFDSLNFEQSEFAYVWVDPYAKGRSIGRGLALEAQYDSKTSTSHIPSFTSKRTIAGLPSVQFWKTAGFGFRVFQQLGLYRYLWKFLNGIRFHKGSLGSGIRTMKKDFMRFQYPLTYKMPNWNYRFYPHGFYEIQFLLPKHLFVSGFTEVMELCRAQGYLSEICAIRKFIPDDGFLSFSGDGFSATVNFSLYRKDPKKLNFFIRQLASVIIKHNGKLYLPKFSSIELEEFHEFYPDYKSFLKVKQSVDPNCRIISRTSRELGLIY